MSRSADPEPPVVILSGGVTALGVMRAFARRGIATFVYPDTAESLRFSRWYRPLQRRSRGAVVPKPSVQVLRDVLAQSGLGTGFVCACSDDWNRILAEYSEDGSANFASMVPTRAALDRLQAKDSLARLLQELRVPMPMTRMIHSSDDVRDLPVSSETFYFLKPADSQSFQVKFGTKGMRVRNAGEARERLEKISAAGLSVVLQEYIPGDSSQHYFVDGYVDQHGDIKALFARRRLRIYPPDFGNSTAMVSVGLPEVAQAVDSVRSVLGAVAYRGIFSAEFKRDPRDAMFKLLEVNTRPWWFVDFAVRCGVDVCRMAYDDAMGRTVEPVLQYKVNATCIYPYYDFFAAQPLLRSGRLSWGQWAMQLLPALQPVGRWNDPLPGAIGFGRVVSSAIRNRLRASAN